MSIDFEDDEAAIDFEKCEDADTFRLAVNEASIFMTERDAREVLSVLLAYFHGRKDK